MSKRIEKTDNYFERVKQRADRTNYRYYLFDYLYFKGEAWGRKWGAGEYASGSAAWSRNCHNAW